MKKIAIIFVIVGLVVGVAYASVEDLEKPIAEKEALRLEKLAMVRKNLEDLRKHRVEKEASMTEEESRASLKEIFKRDFREQAKLVKIMSEARAEVDAEFEVDTPREIFQIDRTALFYTYSTIAQTLAGAFGILGAFILFRLQALNQVLKSVCSSIYNGGRNKRDGVKTPLAQEDWKGFYAVIKDRNLDEIVFNDFTINSGDLESFKFILKTKLELKEKITKKAHKTLWHTVFPIALSLLCLPICSLLSQYSILSLVVLAITTAASIWCLFLYVTLVGEALELGKSKTKPEHKEQPEETTGQDTNIE